MDVETFFSLPYEREKVDWQRFLSEVRQRPMTFAELYEIFRSYGGKHPSNLRRKIKQLRERGELSARYKLIGSKLYAVYMYSGSNRR